MADPSSFCRTKIEVTAMRKEESVSTFTVLCVFISLVSMLADLTTVILVFAEYCNRHYFYWAIATAIFILVPNILINIFSLRWYLMDHRPGITHWLTHCTLFGFIERYVIFLHKAFWCKNFSEPSKDNIYLAQRNDLNLLHFLYTFTGTVPQIILQAYAVIALEGHYQTRVISLCASMTSVCWACVTYVYSLTASDNDNYKWASVFFQSIWHLCMLAARIAAILLFIVTFGMWTLLPLGIHWAAMTFWIVTQKTTFCPNKVEETLYNVVMGFIYCFCYINLREGHTRYRLMMFYTFIITQNFGSLLVYILVSTIHIQKKTWSVASTVCIVAGTIIGMCSMLLYYRWFHARGPIVWKNVEKDIELNNKIMRENQENVPKGSSLTHVRSFKSLQKDKPLDSNPRNESSSPGPVPKIEIETTDKKVLLDHWIARAGTPTFMSAPIGNNSLDTTGIEMYTVENTPNSAHGESMFQNNCKIKKKICSPTELNLKLSSLDNIESSIDEIAANNINIQKRRGICSSDELRDNFNLGIPNNDNFKINKNNHCSETSTDTDGSNKKTSSDSIDMDLDLSFSDINSSDINTFNENIVQKLCLSALKNIKVGNQDADIENIQRIALDILKEMYTKKDKIKNEDTRLLSAAKRDLDTPTEMLSVHDYENICAVNIAREAWGLRSWNVYCDIENWLHDGSVFRERMRDTLTSGSSEISSCLSHELKNSILSTPSAFNSKRAHTYSNVIIKFDKSNQGDYVNTMVCPSAFDETFTAKPCMIDNKDNSQLEPILEELDDLGDIDYPNKKRLNSERSLVATIDEIRKATAANSPNVYHRKDYQWNAPRLSPTKLESSLKRALWKEPSKFNPSNIMEALPEKENIFNISNNLKLAPKKELNIPVTPTLLGSSIDRHVSSENTVVRRKQKSNNLHPQIKKVNNRTDDQRNFSNDIDYLWQLVSEKSMSSASAEDLTQGQHITSSLQSLIGKDNSDASAINVANGNKASNSKKATGSRPRRKFSILRERFEPRTNKKSDEEALYQYNERLQTEATSANVVNVVNKFDLINDDSEPARNKHLNIQESHQVKDMMSTSKNIKEKRSQFMKQVLTPPKFNTKLRHKF